MTATEKLLPLAGAEVHFTAPTSIALSSRLGSEGAILDRGQSITLTDEILAANRDRLGASLFDYVDDPEGQIERWGLVRVRRGPWPEDEPRWVYGSAEWEVAREDARKAAWGIEDPQERADALASVSRRFGPAATTSRTTNARGAR